ncbi:MULTISPECIES: barstar family protein [Burkholderia]|uniref:barstar family protein n=1 Tax=Burkholderia TaxID=32008 RepID=UPI000F586031|nr:MULTISPECIES: barstar family protein [Burkholderia]RQR32578.1 barnase inhibitor [Burkholderia sp. Bp9131]RQR70457.1 barnase inhibitor [Burkholderia sp. Bp9015]RQR82246.1 barnase inhibitor [Burkholderia sp. Bp9011]RQR92047.1 barnase inhibitor [Burkholderia sp. Bp9010]RQR92568.1 barnase inhibitor [Burkholderia sp. Bp8994]
MNRFSVDGKALGDWAKFHDYFASEFGFPGYYGRNMDAWNDCMSDYCYEHGIVSLRIDDAGALKDRNPEIFAALVECSAFINWRATKEGGDPLIVLSYWA